MTEVELAWNLSMLCDAGIETTNMMLQIFTLACLAYPCCIPIAQKELDSVVGDGRMPNFEDLNKLPYIHAMIEETFRWRHILPTGIPHATTKDDHYKGFFIPKNSIIVPLFISMRNDSSMYQAPSEFRPERWLREDAIRKLWVRSQDLPWPLYRAQFLSNCDFETAVEIQHRR